MGKEKYRIHVNKLVGSIEDERALKLIYEIAKRLFLNEFPELEGNED